MASNSDDPSGSQHSKPRGERDPVREKEMEALLAQARNDDVEIAGPAYLQLVDLIADMLHGHIYFKVGQREDAAEIYQETLLRGFKSRKNIQSVHKLPAYFRAIATNLAKDYWRKRLRWREWHGDLISLDEESQVGFLDAASGPAFDEELAARELLQRAWAAVPAEYRECFSLRLRQLDYDKICEQLGIEKETAYNRAFKGKKMFFDELKRLKMEAEHNSAIGAQPRNTPRSTTRSRRYRRNTQAGSDQREDSHGTDEV